MIEKDLHNRNGDFTVCIAHAPSDNEGLQASLCALG